MAVAVGVALGTGVEVAPPLETRVKVVVPLQEPHRSVIVYVPAPIRPPVGICVGPRLVEVPGARTVA